MSIPFFVNQIETFCLKIQKERWNFMGFALKGIIYSLGKKPQDLIPEFTKRKISVTRSQISKALNNKPNGPKGDIVLSTINEIVNQWEKDVQVTSQELHTN